MNRLILIATAVMVISFSACSGGNNTSGELPPAELPPVESPSSTPESGETETATSSLELAGQVIVEFDYEKQSGHASNQFAVWIEDSAGNLVKTLYATKYTANGGYKNRPDSISLWVKKSELASMDKNQVDAITSATPKQGPVSYTWDLTNVNGETVAPGEYTVVVEGSLRWKNSVLYTAKIEVGGSPSAIQAEAEYSYEAADGQDALTSDSPENSMLQNVTVKYIP